MASVTPVLFADNVLDTIVGYPGAVLTTSSETVGFEARRVADGRQDRTSWRPSAAAPHTLTVDLGVGVTKACDSLWLGRGHNLWGATITYETSTNGAAWDASPQVMTVPALGTLGGSPITLVRATGVMSVTEEAACYSFCLAMTARRYHRLTFTATPASPVVPSVMLGARTQFTNYFRAFDDDAKDRKMLSGESDAGYMARGPIYPRRRMEVSLGLIDDTEYDGTIRALGSLIFDKGAPFFGVKNYGDRPERGWLFEFDGTSWDAPKKVTRRELRFRCREVGAKVAV